MEFAPSRSKRRQPAEINVTSLVDIIFNLLLFFMLTTSFSQSQGIEVELPSASTAETQSLQQDLILTINRSGEAIVNGMVLSVEELSMHLNEVKKQKPNLMLVIHADEAVTHSRVVDVIDLAKKNGLKRVAIGTRGD